MRGWPLHRRGLADLVEDLDAAIAWSPAPLNIVAHSLGGRIALELAQQRPMPPSPCWPHYRWMAAGRACLRWRDDRGRASPNCWASPSNHAWHASRLRPWGCSDPASPRDGSVLSRDVSRPRRSAACSKRCCPRRVRSRRAPPSTSLPAARTASCRPTRWCAWPASSERPTPSFSGWLATRFASWARSPDRNWLCSRWRSRRVFRDVGRSDPPRVGPPSAEEIATVMAACARHGITLLGSPPA